MSRASLIGTFEESCHTPKLWILGDSPSVNHVWPGSPKLDNSNSDCADPRRRLKHRSTNQVWICTAGWKSEIGSPFPRSIQGIWFQTPEDARSAASTLSITEYNVVLLIESVSNCTAIGFRVWVSSTYSGNFELEIHILNGAQVIIRIRNSRDRYSAIWCCITRVQQELSESDSSLPPGTEENNASLPSAMFWQTPLNNSSSVSPNVPASKGRERGASSSLFRIGTRD